MGHARAADLRDIADVLDAVRALPGVLERSPGIFYVGRDPFLHFHTKDGARWADAKTGREWGAEMPLPFEATARAKAAFLREVRVRLAACRGDVRARRAGSRRRAGR
jgi:hypothetical protein